MIRVMIVEDEPPTLRRIAGLVEQLDPAFTVAATAMDGQAALNLLKTTHIDVIITDIRMPVMNGLELMDRVRAQYPECMLVVLSGYQDFEYVSRAIRARSLDYLLKPVSAQELRGLLARVREQYMKMSRERLTRDLSMRLNKSAAGVKSAPGADEPMGLCLFLAGSFPAGEDAEMYPAADFWETRSLETLAGELTPGFTWEFMGNTQVERILIFQTPKEQLGSLAQCLHEALLDESGIPVSCAYMRGRVELNDTSGALRVLRAVLRDSVQIGRSLFLGVEPDSAPSDAPGGTEDGEAARQLCAGGAETRALLARVEREQWTQQRVLNLCAQAARQMAQSDREDVRELARQYQSAFPDAVCTALSLKELEVNLIALLASSPADAQDVPAPPDDIVRAMERYLREHYPEHITNQTLATAFGYVPSYISMLFRRRYTLSPSEYLTQIRMEQAKALMTHHPDMLIREVAERVGFKSQHHFSRIFKKTEGVWPTGYRS